MRYPRRTRMHATPQLPLGTRSGGLTQHQVRLTCADAARRRSLHVFGMIKEAGLRNGPALDLLRRCPQDLSRELGVGVITARRPGQVLSEGGRGDIQQRARTRDVAPASLLRLDERIHIHRALAKKPAPRSHPTESTIRRAFARVERMFWTV
jgi:hypothetical protein